MDFHKKSPKFSFINVTGNNTIYIEKKNKKTFQCKKKKKIKVKAVSKRMPAQQ